MTARFIFNSILLLTAVRRLVGLSKSIKTSPQSIASRLLARHRVALMPGAALLVFTYGGKNQHSSNAAQMQHTGIVLKRMKVASQ